MHGKSYHLFLILEEMYLYVKEGLGWVTYCMIVSLVKSNLNLSQCMTWMCLDVIIFRVGELGKLNTLMGLDMM